MKLSFSISSSKSSSTSRSRLSQPNNATTSIDNSRFVTVFDPSETLTSEPSKPLIAPLENTNQWRSTKRMKNLAPPTEDPTSSETTHFVVDRLGVDGASGDTTKYGLNLRSRSDGDNEDGVKGETLGATVLSDEQRFRMEIDNLPEDRGMDEFAEMSVEDFSRAVLQGYGWKEGQGVGRNSKQDVPIVEQKRWAGTSGLGFSTDLPGAGKNEKGRKKKKPNANLPPPPLPSSNTNGGGETRRKNRVVRVTSGKFAGQKGEVLKFVGGGGGGSDEEKVVLRMLRGGEKLSVGVSMVTELESSEEERYLRKLKKMDIKDAEGRNVKRSRDHSDGGRREEEDSSKTVRWLRNQIRVRVIDKKLKDGRVYLKKAVIADVVDPMTCDISMDDESRGGRRALLQVTSGSEMWIENPNLGPFLLKHAIDLIQSDNHRRALDYAIRASKSLEKCSNGKPNLDLVMSLHALAAIHCSLGQHILAVPILERAILIPAVTDDDNGHALAKFAGHMQLGDTYGMLGMLENAIICYSDGLQLQKQVLGESDRRVGETCRYLAEVHVQALQFDEAERLCKLALDIHMENTDPAAVSAQNADRKLMGLICETKGDHDAALEHLVLASMGMTADGRETDMASIDCSIGDIYLSLARYDEAIFAYHKALNKLKTSKGEAHPAVASVFVRLGDLHNKIGKIRESISYCENALKIYAKPPPGTPLEEIATGFIDVSAVYESMNEHDQALRLLQKALKIYEGASSGQQSTVAGIEAQIGVLYYILGKFKESYSSLTNATTKLRAAFVDSVGGNNRTKKKKKSAFFGVALNQLGLACIQLYSIKEAAGLFEEARDILEEEYGLYHPDTLGVYSNLAGTYDAMGRLDEAIEILERIVIIREEKLGTANPDVDEEKRRLSELLKEAGKVRSKKQRSLMTLLS